MLWANHRDQFQKDWYWSNDENDTKYDGVWIQDSLSGVQINFNRNDVNSARAVRRIEVKL